MRRSTAGRLLALSLMVAFGLAWLLALERPAVAQYPPPGSTLVILPEEGNLLTGGTTDFTVRVLDPQARPVADAAITCRLAAGTENGASLTPGEATTGADGGARFRLFAGTKAGTITVRCQSSPAAGQAQVQVQDPDSQVGAARLPTTGQDDTQGPEVEEGAGQPPSEGPAVGPSPPTGEGQAPPAEQPPGPAIGEGAGQPTSPAGQEGGPGGLPLPVAALNAIGAAALLSLAMGAVFILSRIK